MNSSNVIVLVDAASAAFFWESKTKPGGNACRYWHVSPVLHVLHAIKMVQESELDGLTVWTLPKPTIFTTFHGINKVFADYLVVVWNSFITNEKGSLTSVVVLGFPAFESTTVLNLASSHLSIVSSNTRVKNLSWLEWTNKPFALSILSSVYKSFFTAFRSILGSWENLHLVPFSHVPALKKAHKSVLGSEYAAWTRSN